MRRVIGMFVGALAVLLVPAALAQPAAPVRVALETSEGRIVIELATERAPVTTANFLRYVDQKRLDGTVFYRTVKVDARYGFVQFGVDGDPKRVLKPVAHEPTTQTGLTHTDGVVSIARNAPGSARGEFTIMLGDQRASFDAHPDQPGDNLGYAAFGKVVEGMDVVLKIFDAPVSETTTIRGRSRAKCPSRR